MAYDIIGDIHGHARSLRALLRQLGYRDHSGVWRHPDRRAVFLGDFIDGGPHQRETLEIARPMIESGAALSVMGNHEFNAIAFATPRGDGDHLRPRTQGNRKQHAAFLNDYAPDSAAYREVIEWFKTLPLWLELEGLRVVHACWDRALMDRINQVYDGPHLTESLLQRANPKREQREDCWEFGALETLLKGREIPLPRGSHFEDRYGKRRHHMRVRWWDRTATTYRGKYLGSPEFASHIPDDQIEGDHGIDYGYEEPPVFLGHYWLSGTPAPLESNVACLDYSVARAGGKLTAYRWNGEQALRREGFVWVDRQE